MADVAKYVEEMLGLGKFKKHEETGEVHSVDPQGNLEGPINLEAISERLALEAVAEKVAAREYRDDSHDRGSEVVLIALKVTDAHDPANLVLQVVGGEGDDITLRLSKAGLVAAEEVAKRLVTRSRG